MNDPRVDTAPGTIRNPTEQSVNNHGRNRAARRSFQLAWPGYGRSVARICFIGDRRRTRRVLLDDRVPLLLLDNVLDPLVEAVRHDRNP